MKLVKELGDYCEIKRCRQKSYLNYIGKHVCEKHWKLHCDELNDFNLKEEFEDETI